MNKKEIISKIIDSVVVPAGIAGFAYLLFKKKLSADIEALKSFENSIRMMVESEQQSNS